MLAPWAQPRQSVRRSGARPVAVRRARSATSRGRRPCRSRSGAPAGADGPVLRPRSVARTRNGPAPAWSTVTTSSSSAARSRRASRRGCTTRPGRRGGSPPRAAASARWWPRGHSGPPGRRSNDAVPVLVLDGLHRVGERGRRRQQPVAELGWPRLRQLRRCRRHAARRTRTSATGLAAHEPRRCTPARASPFRARWATTWARVHPGSSDGAARSSAVRASTVRLKACDESWRPDRAHGLHPESPRAGQIPAQLAGTRISTQSSGQSSMIGRNTDCIRCRGGATACGPNTLARTGAVSTPSGAVSR